MFKKGEQERGCLADLLDLMQVSNTASRNPNDDSRSLNEQCKTIDGAGISLCKCTRNLCNSSSKDFYFSLSVYIFIGFVVYQFPSAFLS